MYRCFPVSPWRAGQQAHHRRVEEGSVTQRGRGSMQVPSQLSGREEQKGSHRGWWLPGLVCPGQTQGGRSGTQTTTLHTSAATTTSSKHCNDGYRSSRDRQHRISPCHSTCPLCTATLRDASGRRRPRLQHHHTGPRATRTRAYRGCRRCCTTKVIHHLITLVVAVTGRCLLRVAPGGEQLAFCLACPESTQMPAERAEVRFCSC